MIIIPIGSDHKRNRFPKLTVGIIVACAAIYVITFWVNQVHWVVASPAFQKLIEIEQPLMIKYLADQGEKNPEKAFMKIMYHPVRRYTFQDEFRQAMRDGEVLPSDSFEFIEWKQVYAKFEEALKGDVHYVLGFVPNDPGLVSIFSHLFMHGDFWHLFWNMVFLWLTGASLEDVWSRKYVAVIYLAGGVAAALSQYAVNPASDVPMIGASGAIAALMGAYTVRFARNRLLFAYFKWQFWVPAWIPLLFWFGREIYRAIFVWNEFTGVAVWAHVGGFLFGAAAALAIRTAKAEDTLFANELSAQDRKEQEKAAKKAGPPPRQIEVQKGIEARQLGRHEEAEQFFLAAIENRPDDFEAREELIRLYQMTGKNEEAARAMGEMVEAHLRASARETAMAWYGEISRRNLLEASAGPWMFTIAAELARRQAWEAAACNYTAFARVRPDDPRAPKALFMAASMLVEKLDRPGEAVPILEYLQKSRPDWMTDQVGAALTAARKKSGG